MLLEYLKRAKLNRKWRSLNQHNSTVLCRICDINMLSVGNGTYGGLDVLTFNDINRLKIGNYCSIGPKVVFLLSSEHYSNHISTFPYKSKIVSGELEGISKGDIIVQDDVWIGYGATILSGVKICQGAIIAAGAVVTNDIPAYSIAVGVPAKVIKMRFDDDIIEFLNTLDYESLDEAIIKAHIDDLYEDIDNIYLSDLKTKLEWFPKKSGNDSFD